MVEQTSWIGVEEKELGSGSVDGPLWLSCNAAHPHYNNAGEG